MSQATRAGRVSAALLLGTIGFQASSLTSTIIEDDGIRCAELDFTTSRLLPGAKGLTPNNASQSSAKMFSRFRREFEELSLLGRGGFGRVVQARNRIDGQQYAVKKIPIGHIDQSDICAPELNVEVPLNVAVNAMPEKTETGLHLLREARTMAQVCKHRNCVRYFQSWLEIESDSSESEPEDSEPDSRDLSQSWSIDSVPTSDASHAVACATESAERAKRLVLYIQMQLCNFDTLAKWIEWTRKEATPVPRSTLLDIMRQILAGLDHIHRKRYIHFDLSPSNIFLKKKADSTVHIKLGDFGLAVPKRDLTEIPNHSHGQLLYMSPERMRHRPKDCDETVDIFAAGVIFFELMYRFRTEMERFHVLTKLRSSHLFPTDFEEKIPDEEICRIIRRMTSLDSKSRPSAAELLLSPTFAGSRLEPDALLHQLKLKEEALRQQAEIIEKLQMQLHSQGGAVSQI